MFYFNFLLFAKSLLFFASNLMVIFMSVKTIVVCLTYVYIFGRCQVVDIFSCHEVFLKKT